jgi:SAM-dependent methyltransferase
MALTKTALKLLQPYLLGARVLCLGYPDLLMTPQEAQAILRCGGLYRRSYHGADHKEAIELPETEEAFAQAGVRHFEAVDVQPSRGCERQVDLNDPQSLGEFDLVIDAGTIEHCANIGQALMNAAHAVIPGGRIFHSPPLFMINHGFYNVSPTLLHDFYTQNDWVIEHLSGFVAAAPYNEFAVPPVARARVQENSALYFLAYRRTPTVLRWPVQSRYMRRG